MLSEGADVSLVMFGAAGAGGLPVLHNSLGLGQVDMDETNIS